MQRMPEGLPDLVGTLSCQWAAELLPLLMRFLSLLLLCDVLLSVLLAKEAEVMFGIPPWRELFTAREALWSRNSSNGVTVPSKTTKEELFTIWYSCSALSGLTYFDI